MPIFSYGQETATVNRRSGSTSTPTSNPYLSDDDQEPDSVKQQEPEGIIFDSGEEADSILKTKVFAFEPTIRGVKIYSTEHPSLEPTGVQFMNPTYRMDGRFFLDLGALGQCQTSLYPYNSSDGYNPLVFNLLPDIHPVYRRNLHSHKLYQTLTPYTMLGYGSSLNKDYQIHIIHTQNIKPRWNIAFLYDLVSRDGLYTNSDVTNHVIDITTNYYSVDSRYQLQAGINLNRLRQEENGGVQNDTTCWDYPRESGVPVNMYKGQNQWRDFEVWIHQSFNTVRQFEHLRPIVETIQDTICRDTIVGYDTIRPHQPHTYNTGVFALDLNFARHRRIFYDSQADSWFYNGTAPDTSFYFDSTAHYKFAAELYWTNDAYMSHRWRNPLVLHFGIRPEYNTLRFAGDTTLGSARLHEFTLSPFAKASIAIGDLLFSAQAEEVNGSRRTGDYRINAALSYGGVKLSVLSEAVSPDLVYYHNEGYYSWDKAPDSYRKTKRQQAAAEYAMQRGDTGIVRNLNAGVYGTLLSDNIWFNSAMQPVQGNGTGMLLQGKAAARLRFGWFNIALQEMLQYSSDAEVVRVPLFASKNSFYADVNVFHNALRLQTGFDLRYHTKYKADCWNPVLGAFYRQDDVEVGNYLVADFWVNLQIKRASIYIKASHFNAPLEEIMEDLTGRKPSYFSLPHYPLEGFGLYWGLTWKFFN